MRVAKRLLRLARLAHAVFGRWSIWNSVNRKTNPERNLNPKPRQTCRFEGLSAACETARPSSKTDESCVRPTGAAPRRAWGSSLQVPHVVTSLFNDWKRFCFVLREIASGENGRP